MDIKTYISSGILENYVLGATTEQENKKIQRLAQQYPEVEAEIEANKKALMDYIMLYEEEPPEEMQDKIWEELSTIKTPEVAPLSFQIYTNPSKDKTPKIRWKSYVAAASWIFLVLSIVYNIYLYQQWQDTQSQLLSLQSEKNTMAQDFDVQTTRLAEVSNELAILTNPRNKVVDLSGAEDFAQFSATVYWDTQTKQVFITSQLPTPPTGKQYQLWYVKKGEVIDAGVFDASTQAAKVHKMIVVPEADTFVVTLEKKGGVPVAEGPVCAVGKVI